MNERSLLHRVAWIDGYLVANLETTENLQLDPVIAARLYSLKVNASHLSDYGWIDSLRPGFLLLLRREGLKHG